MMHAGISVAIIVAKVGSIVVLYWLDLRAPMLIDTDEFNE